MISPNFSECQLQDLINAEIYNLLDKNRGKKYPPIIVSLRKEHFLGWDTGFYFPWLNPPPNLDHKGCNFFIQYKLSDLIEGPKGRVFSLWGCPYLRFKIALHNHNQFDNLKLLADQGYFVYYSTNHVLKDWELFQLASSNTILDEIPFLDVSMIKGKHTHVTFTRDSSHFLLCSEPIEIPLMKWEQIQTIAKEGTGSTLSEDIKILSNFIFSLEKRIGIFERSNFQKDMEIFSNLQNEIRIVYEAIVIARYLKRYLDLFWYKIW